MKKYYLAVGEDKKGPFDLTELKEMTELSDDSLIWFEGQEGWKKLFEIPEIYNEMKSKMPPPLPKKGIVPPIPKSDPTKEKIANTPKQKEKEKEKKSNSWIYVLIALGVIGAGIFFVSQNSGSSSTYDTYGNSNSSTSTSTYKEKVMSVGEVERANPVKFLDATGTYIPNLLGGKLKVNGTVTNSATVTSYKDATVRVSFYSKSGTKLGTEDYVIYEIFPPGRTKKFKLKVTNYRDVETIGWDVVKAKPN